MCKRMSGHYRGNSFEFICNVVIRGVAQDRSLLSPIGIRGGEPCEIVLETETQGPVHGTVAYPLEGSDFHVPARSFERLAAPLQAGVPLANIGRRTVDVHPAGSDLAFIGSAALTKRRRPAFGVVPVNFLVRANNLWRRFIHRLASKPIVDIVQFRPAPF